MTATPLRTTQCRVSDEQSRADAARCVFVVEGAASPQLPLRLLGMFAQQDLLPLRVHWDRRDADFTLTVVQDGINAHRASIIVEKMRMLPEVASASLCM